jgi:TPP-dependent pyruvate/acetoin dehydrogenase alpha subunit
MAPLTAPDRQRLYHFMRLSRAVEDAAWALSAQGRLVGRLYTAHGQEAIPVGTAYALAADDVIAPMYRDLGAHLVRGVAPVEVFSQYMGKRASSNAGKDSGLHMGDMARGIIGMISVLPDSLPVAVGAALAFRLRGEARVAMTWFGDGATSTGAFHEAVNCAAVLRAPIVLVCENNQWALSTPNAAEFAAPTIAERAAAYGIPGQRVDGNDVEAVYRAAAEAVQRAREGGGPTLLECVTMRMRGHSIIDPAEYVPKEQLAEWAQRDPILRYRTVLEAEGLFDPAVDELILAQVETAVLAAEALEDPLAEDAHVGVFAAPIPLGGADA